MSFAAKWVWLGVLFALLIAATLASLLIGTRILSFASLASLLGSASGDPLEQTILSASRVPRTLVAICVGMALGLAGAILQTVTRNLLAEPGLLGVNAGAALAVVLTVSLSTSYPSLVVLGGMATLGAGLSGCAVFLLAGGTGAFGASPLRLILSGAVMAIMLGALTQVVLLMDPDVFSASQTWLAGSLADRPKAMVWTYLPILAACVLVGVFLSGPMGVLMVSETQGRALGANIAKLRLFALLLAAGLCGVAVSLAGPVAFVGLIAPHVARWITGPQPTALFATTAVFGAAFVLAADVVARRLVAPSELPVGLAIAAVGVPFYLFLLGQKQWR